MKTTKRTTTRLAFTLIELLVVVAIIFIVLAIIPTPGRGTKDRALTIQCMTISDSLVSFSFFTPQTQVKISSRGRPPKI